MAAQGQNKGFHVLDEFVCEAVHDASVPLANRANQGRNEGMSVVEELLFEAGREPTTEAREGSEPRQSLGPTALNDAIQSEARRLAAIIAASADPLGAATLFQKFLLAELGGSEKTAAAALEIRRAAGH
jgi:hypothetical protein